MLKRSLFVTALIVFNLLLTQSSFAGSFWYGDYPFYNDLVRNHSWKDLKAHYYEDTGFIGSRHRIVVIWDPKKPYRSEEAHKGKLNVRLLKGEQAFQWLKRMKLVSGDMLGLTGQRWKKTSRYHKWEQAMKSGSLYWQLSPNNRTSLQPGQDLCGDKVPREKRLELKEKVLLKKKWGGRGFHNDEMGYGNQIAGYQQSYHYEGNVKIWEKRINCYENCITTYESAGKTYKAGMDCLQCRRDCKKDIPYMKCPQKN
jgi:hypothetical protein